MRFRSRANIGGILCVGILGSGLIACTPPHPHARLRPPFREITALDCPSDQGRLTLRSKSADGKTCAYVSGAGDEVTLSLIPIINGNVQATLAPVESEINAELPIAVRGTASGASAQTWGKDKDHVDLDLPGIHIHSRGDGHAEIDTAGVHVVAQDAAPGAPHGEGQVMVIDPRHGGVTVNAHSGGAQIRVNQPGPGVRQAYVLESDQAGPNGYRLAGYEARGPANGPIVVAKILAKGHDADDLRHSVRELLRTNVGG